MPKHSGIFYTDRGRGPTVLLIHGLCETHELWKTIGGKLPSGFRFIAIDLPGFGESDPLPGKISIKAVAKSVLEFMNSMNQGTYNVVSHSLGGYVMLEMAKQDSKSISSLCLFHSTALPDSPEKKISRDKVIEFVKRNGVSTFIKAFIPPLFFNSEHPAVAELVVVGSRTPLDTVVNYTAAMRDRQDRTDVLKTFVNPILFIAGENDPGITVDTLRGQALMSKSSMFRTVARVAHMGMLEEPGVTAEILENFLRRV
jgi:pimeloyl-ACP methyl ester carboxylesterase